MRAPQPPSLLLVGALALAACAGSDTKQQAELQSPESKIWDEKSPYGFHRAMAQTLLRTGKPAGAVQHIHQMLSMEPDKPEPHYLMAKAQLAMGLHSEAKKSLRTSIRFGPTHAAAISLLGVVEDRLGHHEAALKHHRKALVIAPNDAGFLNNLGFCLFLLTRYGEAVNAYRAALQRDPSKRRIHNNLGFTYAKQNKMDLAYKHFRLAGGVAAADNNMGFALERRGELTKAYHYYLKAANRDPSAPLVQENLARVCKRLGKPLPELLKSSGHKGPRDG